VGRRRVLDAEAMGYNTSGWTIDTLRQHIDIVLAERELRYEQRFQASQVALQAALTADRALVQAALAAQEKSTQAAMVAAKEAVGKTERDAEKRFELLNELRAGVATSQQFDALEKMLNELRTEVVGMRQRGVGVSASWAMMLGLGGLILTIIGVAVAIVVASQ
jgi:hypothetical protein